MINLAGPAPTKLSDYYVMNYDDMCSRPLSDLLRDYYSRNVMPKLQGIPLDVDPDLEGSMVFGSFNGECRSWILMMYEYLIPVLTEEEKIHMLLHLVGIVPFVGTAAEVYNTYLYFSEGEFLDGFVNIGFTLLSAYADTKLAQRIKGSEKAIVVNSETIKKIDSIPNDILPIPVKG